MNVTCTGRKVNLKDAFKPVSYTHLFPKRHFFCENTVFRPEKTAKDLAKPLYIM